MQMLKMEMSKVHLCHVKLKFSQRPSIWSPNMAIFGGCPITMPLGGEVRIGSE